LEMESTQFIVTQKNSKQLWNKLFGIDYTVESMDDLRRSAGTKYTVRHKGDDTWVCDCKSFIFDTGTQSVTMKDTRQKHEKTCKHIRSVMKKEKLPFMATGFR